MFCLGEVAAGLLSHSLALISDAGHNFSDALALGLSGFAAWLAGKPATPRYTYGYHRAAILIPLFNAASLVVIAAAIAAAALWRLFQPGPVSGTPMIVVAALAFVLNAVIAWTLSGHAQGSLNTRAVFVHMVGDALSSLTVVAAGGVVHYTGWVYADPIVSLLIAAFILHSATGILREATGILMENAPRGLDIAAVVRVIRSVSPVQAVRHLHIWSVKDGMAILSCHVILPEASTLKDCMGVIDAISARLHDEFSIGHATIQTEVEGHCRIENSGDLFCAMQSHEHIDHRH